MSATDWQGGGEPGHGGLWGHEPLPPTMQHGQQPAPTAGPPVPGGGQYGTAGASGGGYTVGPLRAAPQQGGSTSPTATRTSGPGLAAPQPGQPVMPGGVPGGLPPIPGYTPPAQTPVNSAPNQVAPISGGTQSQNPLQPNPGEIASTAPANVQQFGPTPEVNPTYVAPAQQQALFGSATTVDPNQNLGYMQQYEGLLAQGLAPQFQQQNQGLADQLAARGLTNSGTGQQLTNELYGQQAAALASGLQPIVSQGYSYTQQDIQGNQGAQNQYGLANLGYGNAALGQNAAYTQQANMANAGASNETNVLNAQYYNQDRMSNYGAYNNYENELLGLGAGNFNALQSAYLNSFGPNTGVESLYGNALSGQQNMYGSVYNNAANAQAQQAQMAMMALSAGG